MSIKTFIKRISGKTTAVKLPPTKLPKSINTADMERCLYCDSSPEYITAPIRGYPVTKHTIRCQNAGKLCQSVTIDFPAEMPTMINATVLVWNLLNVRPSGD